MGIEYSHTATYDEKEDYDEKAQNAYKSTFQYDYDDVQEVCVNAHDKRLPIYETAHKNDCIAQCIGQLRIYYHQSIGGGYAIGTGTIFHVERDKCVVLTCAHNIRTTIYHCVKNNCHGKMLSNEPCNKCNGAVSERDGLEKAVRVTFVRRGIEKDTFGNHETEYECDMKECVIDDEKYSKCPHPTSGNDFAILVINNKSAAEYYHNKCKNIFLVNNLNLFDIDRRQMILFGHPNDKDVGRQLWGMATPNTNQFKCGSNMDTLELYLINEEIDTVKGQSGSSIYCVGDKEDIFWIVSVHTGGSKKRGQNYGTLFSVHTLQWIQQSLKKINIDLHSKIIQQGTKYSIIYDQVTSEMKTMRYLIDGLVQENKHLKMEKKKINDKYKQLKKDHQNCAQADVAKNSNKYYNGQQIKAKEPPHHGSKTVNNKFYDATIVHVQQDRLKVKFAKWPDDKFDRWIKQSQYNEYINAETNSSVSSVSKYDAKNADNFQIGQQIQARDPQFPLEVRFYDAKIQTIESDRIKVRYDKWPQQKYDKWIIRNQYDNYIKITNADLVVNKNESNKFHVGQRIQARDSSYPTNKHNKFFKATVKEICEDGMKIKYDNWPDDKYDQWIKKDLYHSHIRIQKI